MVSDNQKYSRSLTVFITSKLQVHICYILSSGLKVFLCNTWKRHFRARYRLLTSAHVMFFSPCFGISFPFLCFRGVWCFASCVRRSSRALHPSSALLSLLLAPQTCFLFGDHPSYSWAWHTDQRHPDAALRACFSRSEVMCLCWLNNSVAKNNQNRKNIFTPVTTIMYQSGPVPSVLRD